jgi:hypothetical protein
MSAKRKVWQQFLVVKMKIRNICQLSLMTLVFLTSFAQPSGATWLTYSEWQQLPQASQAFYIAGAFDTYSTLGNFDRYKHFEGCVKRRGITLQQLSANIEKFASTRPRLQNSFVHLAMANYLLQLCGSPTTD